MSDSDTDGKTPSDEPTRPMDDEPQTMQLPPPSEYVTKPLTRDEEEPPWTFVLADIDPERQDYADFYAALNDYGFRYALMDDEDNVLNSKPDFFILGHLRKPTPVWFAEATFDLDELRDKLSRHIHYGGLVVLQSSLISSIDAKGMNDFVMEQIMLEDEPDEQTD